MQAEYALLASGSDDTQKVGLQRQLDDLDGLTAILSTLELFDAVPGQDFLLRSRLGLMQGDLDVQASEEKS